MRELKIIVLGSILILAIEGVYFLRPKVAPKVLSEEVTATVAPTTTPMPSDTPTPTPIASLKPTAQVGKPTPRPTPMQLSLVSALIDENASKYGVDVNVMRALALCESDLNTSAKNGAYIGLFQFGPVTWKNIRTEMGISTDLNLRYSGEESAKTASYAVSKGKRGIWPNCNP